MTTTTTTNYGWTIPQDSELVKDGAAAIRTLGNAADASLKTVSDAAIKATIVDAKGDLIAATAADTVARLAVGTDGQVLTADAASSAGVKWATVSGGGMTSLASGTLSGSSVSISSISGSYKSLRLVVNNPYSSTATPLYLQVNGITSNTYGYHRLNNGTVFQQGNGSELNTTSGINLPTTSTIYVGVVIDFENYAATNAMKIINGSYYRTSGDGVFGVWFGGVTTSSAITSISIYPPGYTFSGGTYELFGVK